MARRYRTNVREEKAVEYTLQIIGLEQYKNAWLVINNNAREFPDSIYKVSNTAGSNIYVLCPANSAANTKEWLEQFGEITNVDEDKVAVFVDVCCEYTKSFDEDYVDSEYILGETN